MNYEEKYKEALDLMKDCVPDENGLVHVRPEDIFSELAETKDERIRKAILSGLKYLEAELGWDAVGNVDILDAYAWLEKQGEQKATDKVEPFKWSEEDENILEYTKEAVINTWGGDTQDEILDWLENIKKRIGE